jgi:2-methylcitrate dehydratase PrpD
MRILSQTLTEKLAARMTCPVEAADRARARHHLLDWVACVCGGWTSPVADVARAAEPDSLTRYALLGNVLEMDDVHRAAILHPGPVVWPAALCAARDKGASLGAVLDAAVRGYEAMISTGSSFDAHHYAHFHPTSTAGGFGAVAATGSVYQFTPAQYVWGFGNAGSMAGGLWHMRHDPAAMTKQLHVAHASLAGVWVARLAAQGFTGPAELLEGTQGLYAAMVSTPNVAAFADRTSWQIHDVSFKPWAACRHAHPAIDAALQLKQTRGSLEGEILVETYADALTFCDKPHPQTVMEAKFSLQHAVALVVVRGVPTLADFEPDGIHNPDIIAARSRIRLTESTTHSARYPAHFGARVSSSGAALDLVDTLGDPEKPLPPEGLRQKARDLMAWGRIKNASSLIGWIETASEDAPISELLDLLP